jgi:hypothetical protein
VFDASAFGPEKGAAEYETAQRRIVDELVSSVRSGTPHPLDIHRGVHLQRLIDYAASQLAV